MPDWLDFLIDVGIFIVKTLVFVGFWIGILTVLAIGAQREGSDYWMFALG